MSAQDPDPASRHDDVADPGAELPRDIEPVLAEIVETPPPPPKPSMIPETASPEPRSLEANEPAGDAEGIWVAELVPVHEAPPDHYTARAGATGSILLGLLALSTSWLTLWSLFPAVLGIGFGIWGWSSPFPKRALVGGLLCLSAALLGVLVGLFGRPIASMSARVSPDSPTVIVKPSTTTSLGVSEARSAEIGSDVSAATTTTLRR